MKKFITILFSLLFTVCAYSQVGPLQDNKGILVKYNNQLIKVGTSSTELKWSAFPPDTIISFDIVVGGAGEPFTSLLTEIRSYWTLEESADNAVDSVGTADLPVVGTVTRQQAGVIDYCYQFTTDGKLGPIDTDFEFTGSFTVGCWVKTTASGAYQGLITNNAPVTNRGWDLMTTSGSMKAWFAIRGDWGTAQIIGDNVIEDGVWHYIAASYSAADDTIKLWLDGILDNSAKAASGPVYDVDCRFNIGSRYAGNFFTGYIDEPATWNRELTHVEINALVAEAQYPFLGEGSGGDSLELTTLGYDPRIDSVIINWEYDGDGWPTDEEDGTIKFAFPASDTVLYHDTIFSWPGIKDTIVRFTAWSGLDDNWTPVPNKDTVLVDSSDISPPPQDLPGFDIIFEQDFEQHTALPKEYTYSLFVADNWDALGNDWRQSDNRYPAEWVGHLRDSIKVDPITNSNIIQFSVCGHTLGGYPCLGGQGGDNWKFPIGYHTETYVSYNLLLRPGWLWSSGGKIGIVQSAGANVPHGTGYPTGASGMTNEVMWDWDHDGALEYYIYYPDMSNNLPYGDKWRWNDFQPAGAGINYNEFGEVVPEIGVWTNITTRTVVNTFTGTTANYDGIVEAYVNGCLVERRSGIRLILYPSKDLGLDWVFVAFFFGGGGPALREDRFWVDDVVVFTYDEEVDVPRGNVASPSARVLALPNWPKEVE